MICCTRRRACRSPRLPKLTRRSARGCRRLALVSVVVIDLCVKSAVARLARSRRSCAGPPPRRGPFAGLGIICFLVDQDRKKESGLFVVVAVVVSAVEAGNGILQRQTQLDELVLD